jgi:hypothetical protein
MYLETVNTDLRIILIGGNVWPLGMNVDLKGFLFTSWGERTLPTHGLHPLGPTSSLGVNFANMGQLHPRDQISPLGARLKTGLSFANKSL